MIRLVVWSTNFFQQEKKMADFSETTGHMLPSADSGLGLYG